jgi:hypothetical protein
MNSPTAITFFFIFIISQFACSKTFASTHPNQCPTGQHWVRAYHRSAYTRVDGTLVSATEVSSHCQSNPPAYAIWHDRLKSGKPPHWQYPAEKAHAWTDDEKEKVIEALSELPSDILLNSVEGIYRLEKSIENPANPASNHENQIALYDSALKPGVDTARILAHEFAHKIYSQVYDEKERVKYAISADWMGVPIGNTLTLIPSPIRDGFVEEDGSLNPEEDFSNNIEYFLFNPTTLKSKTPKVYDWIQKKYGDKFKIRRSH